MDEYELEQLRRNPQWMTVLDLYYQRQVQSREQIPDFDGWIPRIHDVPDTAVEELPQIHGKLIAFGFLKFDLTGRDAGIRYQLTPLGRQSLSGTMTVDEEGESAETADALSLFPRN